MTQGRSSDREFGAQAMEGIPKVSVKLCLYLYFVETWASEAITSGLLPDIIVNSNHMIEYLKYAATHQLFNRKVPAFLESIRLFSLL